MTVCVILHGAGSTPEFVERAFGPAVAARGWTLVAPDVAGLDMDDMVEAIALARPDVVGGVSLGAHAAVLHAVHRDWSGPVYAVMPAWTGTPDHVAALTRHTADEIDARGTPAVLARIRTLTGDDWVTDELLRAWRARPAGELAHSLRVAAGQPAPDAVELRQVRGAVTIVALDADPTHPAEVARTWHAHLRSSRLHILARDLGGHAPQALAGHLDEVRPR